MPHNESSSNLNHQMYEHPDICWRSVNDCCINYQRNYSRLNIDNNFYLELKRYRPTEHICNNKFEPGLMSKTLHNNYFMEKEKEIHSEEDKGNFSDLKVFHTENIININENLNPMDINDISEESDNNLNEDMNNFGLLLDERESEYELIFNESNNILNPEITSNNNLINANQDNQVNNPETNQSNNNNIFTVKTKKQRGRIAKNDKKIKSNKIHKSTALDNVLTKVQSHFMKFLIDVSNIIIIDEIKEKNFAFYDIDYNIKKNINHKHFEQLKQVKISDILKYQISSKHKKIDKNNNEEVCEKVGGLSKNIKNFFDMNYLDLFKLYYNECEPLKEINIKGKKYIFPSNIKSFYHLIQKYKDNKEHKKALIENTKIAYFSDFKTIKLTLQKTNISKNN